jgi:PiT family inorganic phosphate transporter
MAPTIQRIFPSGGSLIATEALLVTIAAFLVAKALRAPLSLSMSLVALLIGLSTSHHLPIDYGYASTVIVLWVAAPLISLAFGFVFLKLIDRARPRDVWRRIFAYKVLLIVCSFLAAFVLGANTVGLIVALGGFDVLTVGASVLAILLGAWYLSEGEIRRVGQDLFSLRYPNALASLLVSTVLVELSTLLAVPLSSTQTLAAAVLGAGGAYRHRLLSLRPFIVIVAAWVIVPTLSFAVGYVL